jgi:hypothetical protein
MAWREINLRIIKAENGFAVMTGGGEMGQRYESMWVAADIAEVAKNIVAMMVAKQLCPPQDLDTLLKELVDD